MAVLRIKKKGNFVILDKTCLGQPGLSWGAKGLHSYLMGLRDDACVQVEKLVEKSTNGRDAVRGYVNELKKAGYITTAWVRKAESGEYERLEYSVYELPQATLDEIQATDYQSPDQPATAFQSSDNPSPENTAPYINNKYLNKTNNKNKQITAAASGNGQELLFAEEKTKAAAVFSDQNKSGNEKPFSRPLASQPVSYLSPEDAVIGKTLTANQQTRIASLAKKLNPINSEKLTQEISYCLLNPGHFTACGQDFSRKLNAIRAIMLRGEWQTPVGMVLEEQDNKTFALSALEYQLHSAYAEVHHFQRLLDCAKESARESLEEIIQGSKNKISKIEEELSHMKASFSRSSKVIPIRG